MENRPDPAELASATQRFLNYFFDVVFIKLISIGILLVAGTLGILVPYQVFFRWLFTLNIGLLYYVVLEANYGQTLGKMATGTIVITEDGKRPDLGTIILRSLCRFIPFEIFSFLGFQGGPVGWHDSLSKTRVIVKRIESE